MRYAEELDVVRGVVRGRFGEESEDVVQEAMISALKARDQLNHPERRKAWLRQITRRQIVDFVRRRRRRSDAVAMLPEPEPTPEARLLSEERAARVREAVEALPEPQATAARAFYLEGKSYAHIQAEQGLSKEGLAGRLWRARQALKRSLSDLHGVAPLGASLRAGAAISVWNPLTQALTSLFLPWAHARWGARTTWWVALLISLPLLVLMGFVPEASGLVAAVGGAWLAEALVGAEDSRREVALAVGALLLVSGALVGDSVWMLGVGVWWLSAHGAARAAVEGRWLHMSIALGIVGLGIALTAALGLTRITLLVVPAAAFLTGLLLCVESLPTRRLKPALVGAVLMVFTVWVVHPLIIEHWYR